MGAQASPVGGNIPRISHKIERDVLIRRNCRKVFVSCPRLRFITAAHNQGRAEEEGRKKSTLWSPASIYRLDKVLPPEIARCIHNHFDKKWNIPVYPLLAYVLSSLLRLAFFSHIRSNQRDSPLNFFSPFCNAAARNLLYVHEKYCRSRYVLILSVCLDKHVVL